MKYGRGLIQKRPLWLYLERWTRRIVLSTASFALVSLFVLVAGSAATVLVGA